MNDLVEEFNAHSWREIRIPPSFSREDVLKKTGGECFYCHVLLGEDWQIDHYIPRHLKGTNHFSNLVPSCPDCNRIKGCKMPNEHLMKTLAERRAVLERMKNKWEERGIGLKTL